MPKRSRPFPLVAVTALTTVLALTSCGSTSSGSAQQAGKGRIGIALPTTGQGWPDDGVNMTEQFGLLGYSTMVRNAENDTSVQVEQISDMIKSDVKALIIAAVDGSALTPTLERAAQKKIPVIAFDRLIMNSENVDYYTTFDNAVVGKLQGDFLVEALDLKKADGPFNIELFAGSPDDNNAKYFFDGTMAVLQPYIKSGKLVVRSGQAAFEETVTLKWDEDMAKARMSNLLKRYYTSARVDAVLSPNDGLARGILRALEIAGYGSRAKPYPPVTGQDAELESVKLIASGVQAQSILKDSREMSKATVQMVDLILQGKKPEVNNTTEYNNGVKVVPSFLLQPVTITKENYEAKIIKSGIYTAEDVGN
ncbi:MAG: putative multiple sugar transport system substrate-binding protein [Actinomycetota bacterium]|nr:putative multiple sugar transport system substrate-binding protein [Actinomycetota bacterium]